MFVVDCDRCFACQDDCRMRIRDVQQLTTTATPSSPHEALLHFAICDNADLCCSIIIGSMLVMLYHAKSSLHLHCSWSELVLRHGCPPCCVLLNCACRFDACCCWLPTILTEMYGGMVMGLEEVEVGSRR
jgi:hypothetical protein